MSTTAYAPPAHLMEVLQSLEYEKALEPGDPRYVDTREARGSQLTLNRLAKKFGLDLNGGAMFAPNTKHVLFFGHVGSGKTTELRHYARELGGHERFFTVEVDVVRLLDPHNLQYADTLMALAQVLLQRLDALGVGLSSGALDKIERWFQEQVLETSEAKEFSAAVEAGAKARGGLPWLIELFAKFTASVKANVTYKENLRRVVRNSFAQLADAFNTLVSRAEEALYDAHQGKRILFVIDGTDKMRGEDTERFFLEDAEQLLAIRALVIYTAPLSLKASGSLAGKLDADLMLPMVKLVQPDGTVYEPGRQAMRRILLLRAAPKLFATPDEVERLVDCCGGHPRELLRLLKLCCEVAEGALIDQAAVQAAVKQLAAEYRYFLEAQDYELLVQIDHDPEREGTDERTRRLLYNLALMQYNDGAWRSSHPVVRTLTGYARAESAKPPDSQA